MKNRKLILSFVFVFMAFMLSACSLTTEELTEEVKKNMNESEFFQKNDIKVVDLKLVHKAGNEYTGILKTKEPGGEFSYDVEVLYDGSTYKWEIKEEIIK